MDATAYRSIFGTLLRPCSPSVRVMTGSPLVQSPTRVMTPFFLKAFCTDSRLIAPASFALHERHQSAVKYTKTGLPRARASASAAGEYVLPDWPGTAALRVWPVRIRASFNAETISTASKSRTSQPELFPL